MLHDKATDKSTHTGIKMHDIYCLCQKATNKNPKTGLSLSHDGHATMGS